MLVSWVNPSGGEFWEDHRLVDGFVGVFMVVRSSIDEDVGAVNSQPRALPFTSRRAVNLSGDGIPRGCCQGAPAGLPLASALASRSIRGRGSDGRVDEQDPRPWSHPGRSWHNADFTAPAGVRPGNGEPVS